MRRRRLWRGRFTFVFLLAAGLLFAAGCSSQSSAPRGSVAACVQFGVSAVRQHVTVTSLPPACQGLTRAQFSYAVSSALHSAAVGAHGKVAERERLAAASRYLHYLVASVSAPRSRPPAPPANPVISRTALGIAALIAWLVTVALGLRILARWFRPGRRGRARAGRRQRLPGFNFAHLGLAVVSLLIWIGYLATGLTGLAWAACALLAIVTGLGMALVFLAAAAGPAQRASRPPAAEAPPRDGPRRRRSPAVFVTGAHIAAATLTILLAVLAAIGTA